MSEPDCGAKCSKRQQVPQSRPQALARSMSGFGSKPQIVTLTGCINWDRFQDRFYISD
nr:hypothetical protein [Planktomarina sp.]